MSGGVSALTQNAEKDIVIPLLVQKSLLSLCGGVEHAALAYVVVVRKRRLIFDFVGKDVWDLGLPSC